jgi:5-methylcytosine-specific restriction endonuclease McrA
MRPGALLLRAARTDQRARKAGDAWLTRCLHCGTQVGVREDGVALGTTTLEHIVPRSWFGTRAAAALVALVGAPDDARNLALACARCNQQKGRTHDARGAGDARAREVTVRLLERRLARYVEGP